MSEMQTIEDESMPPLNSANTGALARSRRRTASVKTARKCSSYSRSVPYRVVFAGSKSQYLAEALRPFVIRTNEHGGSALILTYGVRWLAGKEASHPATYSFSSFSDCRASKTS